MKKILLILIIFLIFIVYNINSIWDINVPWWKYVIQKWDTVSNIPKRLNIEVNPIFYKIWLKTIAPEIKLLAWTYTIWKGSNFLNIFSNWLNKPDSLDQEITILPGWNIFDIDEYLTSKWLIQPWELIDISSNIPDDMKEKFGFLKESKSLEWFIYPDTYRIPFDVKIKDIVSYPLDEFNKKIYKVYFENSYKEFYNDLIMASIVEKEERNTDNKPMVAWILLKRFQEWIAIWADATVCYQYKVTSANCSPSFIWEKIYIKSNYNTRNKIGLPPTPISNITKESFEAVYKPETSPYYYYLHDMSGNIHYGKTLQEHNNNKNLYLK